jgi:hypothetical protein
MGLGLFFGLVFYKDVGPNGPADWERRDMSRRRKAASCRRTPKRHVKRGKQAQNGQGNLNPAMG